MPQRQWPEYAVRPNIIYETEISQGSSLGTRKERNFMIYDQQKQLKNRQNSKKKLSIPKLTEMVYRPKKSSVMFSGTSGTAFFSHV